MGGNVTITTANTLMQRWIVGRFVSVMENIGSPK
ncbi:hypothetical protein P3T43_003281 [Paraburkholderia sp. GAS41]|jgi:hypothetical protein